MHPPRSRLTFFKIEQLCRRQWPVINTSKSYCSWTDAQVPWATVGIEIIVLRCCKETLVRMHIGSRGAQPRHRSTHRRPRTVQGEAQLLPYVLKYCCCATIVSVCSSFFIGHSRRARWWCPWCSWLASPWCARLLFYTGGRGGVQRTQIDPRTGRGSEKENGSRRGFLKRPDGVYVF